MSDSVSDPDRRGAASPIDVASIIVRKGSLFAQFHDASRSPKTKRFSLRTTNRDTARRVLAKLERDHLLGTFDPWVDDPWTYDRPRPAKTLTLSGAVDAFLDHKQETGRGARTLKSYRDLLHRFARFVGPGMPAARIAGRDVAAYECSREASGVVVRGGRAHDRRPTTRGGGVRTQMHLDVVDS